MSNENDNPTPNGQAPNGTDPQGQAPNSNGQAPQETSSLSRKDLEEIAAKARAEAAEYRIELSKIKATQKKQEEAAQAAEQQRLKEQGEFKQLAEQHETRVRELEPVAERYSQLSTLVSGQIEAQVKDWPAEVKAFDPGADAPIEQRLTWLEKSKPLIEKLQTQARSQSPGNMPNPRPTASTPEDAQNHFLQQMRSSGKYGA